MIANALAPQPAAAGCLPLYNVAAAVLNDADETGIRRRRWGARLLSALLLAPLHCAFYSWSLLAGPAQGAPAPLLLHLGEYRAEVPLAYRRQQRLLGQRRPHLLEEPGAYGGPELPQADGAVAVHVPLLEQVERDGPRRRLKRLRGLRPAAQAELPRPEPRNKPTSPPPARSNTEVLLKSSTEAGNLRPRAFSGPHRKSVPPITPARGPGRSLTSYGTVQRAKTSNWPKGRYSAKFCPKPRYARRQAAIIACSISCLSDPQSLRRAPFLRDSEKGGGGGCEGGKGERESE